MKDKLEQDLGFARYAGKAEGLFGALQSLIEQGLIKDLISVKSYCEVSILKLEKSYLETRLGIKKGK